MVHDGTAILAIKLISFNNCSGAENSCALPTSNRFSARTCHKWNTWRTSLSIILLYYRNLRYYFSTLRRNMWCTCVPRLRQCSHVSSDLSRNCPIKVMNGERKGVSFIKRDSNASTGDAAKARNTGIQSTASTMYLARSKLSFPIMNSRVSKADCLYILHFSGSAIYI